MVQGSTPPEKRPGFLDAPRWIGGGLAEFLSVGLALLGIASALGALLPPVFSLAGKMDPGAAGILSAVSAAVSVAAWLGYGAAQRLARAHIDRERGLRSATFELQVRFVDRARFHGAMVVRLGEDGLALTGPRSPLLAGACYILATILLQAVHPPTDALMAVGVVLWGGAFWFYAPVRRLLAWSAIDAGILHDSRILLFHRTGKGAEVLSLSGTRSAMERFAAQVEERVPLQRLAADTRSPVAPRPPCPLPPQSPAPPRTAIDARKQRELDETLERLSRL